MTRQTDSQTVVARYSFSEAAAQSAVERTAATGVTHLAEHDAATDTYVVVASR